jgi:hypothetical protein
MARAGGQLRSVADGAEGFWRSCGFQDTGRRNYEGERIFVLAL